MTEADIEMAEHRSKNTLGRSVRTVTDVEDDEHRRTDLRGLSVYRILSSSELNIMTS